MKRKIELLAPAGSYESLLEAVNAGADAVYAGGERFGARAFAKNLDPFHFLKGMEYAHLHGRRVYLTVNTLVKDRELEALLGFLLPLYREGLDGVIVQDLGVLSLVREQFADLPIHCSTQMGVMGVLGAKFMERQGAKRVILARELSLEEIGEINSQVSIETECFVHGALCYSVSGMCLFSSLLGGRSGNRGRCAQPCRLPYNVSWPEGAGRGREVCHVLSLKDLSAVHLLGQLIEAGVTSFKIEGRMKSSRYVRKVVEAYRQCLDSCLERVGDEIVAQPDVAGDARGQTSKRQGRGAVFASEEEIAAQSDVVGDVSGQTSELQGREGISARLVAAGSRSGFTQGYLEGEKGPHMMAMENSSYQQERDLDDNAGKQEKNLYLQKKIKGKLTLSAGKCAILTLMANDASVSLSGEQVQRAKNSPLSEEQVRSWMMETGETFFVFEDLEIEMEEGLFLPVGKLKALRREGLERLLEELLKSGKRELPSCGSLEHGQETWNGKVSAPEGKFSCYGFSAHGQEAGNREVFDPEGERHCCGLSDPLQREGNRVSAPEGEQPYFGSSDHRSETGNRNDSDSKGEQPCFGELDRPARTGGAAGEPQLRVSIDRLELLDVLLPLPQVDAFYIEAFALGDFSPSGLAGRTVSRCREQGKGVYLALPYLFPNAIARKYQNALEDIRALGFDGFLVRNYEECEFLLEHMFDKSIILDYNMYTFNQEAARFFADNGFTCRTLPLELNRGELFAQDTAGSEWIVYGRLPLMVTAQCVKKNMGGCDGKTGTLYLEDRYRKQFPVRAVCPDCMNIVYNSCPLVLFDQADALENIALGSVRFLFTTERGDKARKIIEAYRPGRVEVEELADVLGSGGFTRGHFNRGVK